MKTLPINSNNFPVPGTSVSNQAAVKWSLRVARACGGFVFLGGITGLLGWVLDIRRLADWDDTGISIQPNNTVLMMLGGIALVLIASGRKRLGSCFGIMAGAIGFATFSQYLHGVDLGIDQLLLFGRDWGAAGTVVHGRMGPPASISWTIFGLASLLLATGGRSRKLVPLCALAILLIASLSFTGYLFGADVLYSLPRLTVIAWQTSALFIALAIGLLASMPDLRPVSNVIEDTVTGMLIRRLIVPVVVIPLAFGALRIAGQNAGLYDTAMGTAVLNVILIAVFLLILFNIAAVSSRFERDKRDADRSAFSAAAELAEERLRLKVALEGAAVGVYQWNIGEENVWWSEENHAIFGTDAETFRPTVETFTSLVHPDDRAALWRKSEESVTSGEPFIYEYRILRPSDGAERWIYNRSMVTGDGERKRITGIAADITERKRTEEALEHELRLRKVITDSVPALISYIDDEMRYQFNNKAYERWFGHPADELLGKHMRDVLGDVAFERLRPHVDAALSGRRVSFEQEIPYAEGGTRFIHADYVPDSREDGRVPGYFALISDITESKQAEQAIAASAARQSYRVRLADALRDLDDPLDIQEAAARILGQHLALGRVMYGETDGDDVVIYRCFVDEGVSPILGRLRAADYGERMIAEFRAGQVSFSNDVATDPAISDAERSALRSFNVGAYLGVPLVKNGEWIGTLGLQTIEPHEWTEEEEMLARETAERTWAAVERARAEKALRETNARFDIVRDSAQVGFWFCDLPFDELIWDNRVKEHFWLQPDARVTIDTFYERIHPDDRERTRSAIEDSIANKTQYEIEYRTISAQNGDEKWIRAIGRTFYDADGGPIRFDGVTHDITARFKAEQALRESENRFSTMANTAPAIIWVTEADGTLEFISRGWYEFTGQTETQAFAKEGFGWLDAVHPEDGEEAGQIFLAANNNHESFQLEYRLCRADGEYRWAIDAGRARFDDAGNFIGFIGSVVDVHEGKQAEQTLRASEERFRTLIEEAPFGVYVVDSEFRIAVVNKGTQEKAFANVNPAVGRAFDEAIRILWPEDVAKDIIKIFRHTLETGEPYYSKDFVSPRADTDVVEGYEWELHQMKMPDGSNSVICYYFDSTELRTAQMELAELNRDLEAIVLVRTEALHETNLALAEEMHARIGAEKERIAVLSRMMTAQEDERRRMAIELHDQLGQHMTALRLRLNALSDQARDSEFSASIDQIMLIARELDEDIDAVTLSLRPRSLDMLGLSEALGQYVATWQNQSGILSEFHAHGYREGLLAAETETALFRITQEALHNCAKHSAAGFVSVVLTCRDDRVSLIVEDDGRGFDPQQTLNGNGLGLTSMRERCELIGGELTIEAADSTGTTVLITVPMNEAKNGAGKFPAGALGS